jgi:hypothetical protein
MCRDGGLKKLNGKAATLRALTTEAAAPPEDRATLHPLGVVVGGLDAGGHHKGSQRQKLVRQPRGESAGLGSRQSGDPSMRLRCCKRRFS